jgi:redox-sensitive bicupin YhaK (pirin superfamily)
MRRILLLLVVLGFTLGGCGEVEWFPEQGVSAFSFSPASVSGIAIGSTQTSNTITVKMGDASAAISVTGGEFSINGGPFTATAATVKDGDTVAVRHTAASTAGRTISTTLTIGKKSASFSSTTAGFSEDARFNVAPGSTQTSSTMTLLLPGASAPISVTGGEYSINDAPFISTPGTVNNGNRVAVRHQAANGSTETTVTTTLTVGTENFSFTTSTGSFAEQTVTGSAAAGSVAIAETILRLVSGSHTITLQEGLGNFGLDGETFLDPQTLTLQDGQSLFLSDNGTRGTTVFLIDGVPLTFITTDSP